jgi:hypothetical protein
MVAPSRRPARMFGVKKTPNSEHIAAFQLRSSEFLETPNISPNSDLRACLLRLLAALEGRALAGLGPEARAAVAAAQVRLILMQLQGCSDETAEMLEI